MPSKSNKADETLREDKANRAAISRLASLPEPKLRLPEGADVNPGIVPDSVVERLMEETRRYALYETLWILNGDLPSSDDVAELLAHSRPENRERREEPDVGADYPTRSPGGARPSARIIADERATYDTGQSHGAGSSPDETTAANQQEHA